MAKLLRPGEVAALKGCSKKTIHRACEQGKLNTEYDPVNNAYSIYDDEKLAAWHPGETGPRPAEQ
ncbi:MAG TPA: hypothetical protein VD969_19395 [Symbiobacteriaceae bacterium]|nr:hypothetical protein [Symbiobacteriaceae bacterium]